MVFTRAGRIQKSVFFATKSTAKLTPSHTHWPFEKTAAALYSSEKAPRLTGPDVCLTPIKTFNQQGTGYIRSSERRSQTAGAVNARTLMVRADHPTPYRSYRTTSVLETLRAFFQMSPCHKQNHERELERDEVEAHVFHTG